MANNLAFSQLTFIIQHAPVVSVLLMDSNSPNAQCLARDTTGQRDCVHVFTSLLRTQHIL